MRIWDLPPSALCRKHLLGEHNELHVIWNCITQNKKGWSNHPETCRWKGKLRALYARHENLVYEMQARGYNHKSPLDFDLADGLEIQNQQVESTKSQITKLRHKCKECEERITMEKFTLFWHGPFSQWHPCNFVIDGISYTHAEQYMMAEKARMFGDNETLKKIMEASTPKEQKSLGRKVSGFDKEVWERSARSIVEKGNLAKFSQNPELKAELLKTKGTTLVEASPYDKVWGIGLAAEDPKAINREEWLGTNWLGEVLTKVREILDKD